MAIIKTETLTVNTEKLFYLFQENPDKKFSRAEIAAALGKIRLTPRNILQLENLAKRDLIDAEEQVIGGKMTWFYYLHKS